MGVEKFGYCMFNINLSQLLGEVYQLIGFFVIIFPLNKNLQYHEKCRANQKLILK